MKILEIPISTLEEERSTWFTRVVSTFSGNRTGSSFARLLPLARLLNLNPNRGFYISPWWSLSKSLNILRSYFRKTRENDVFLAGYFHACDIVNPRTGKKNSIFEKQISRVITDVLAFDGIQVAFTTLSEMARNCNALG
jgi:hypothetical protein